MYIILFLLLHMVVQDKVIQLIWKLLFVKPQHFKPRILTELLDSGTLSVILRPRLSSVLWTPSKIMLEKHYLTFLKLSMWSGRVLGLLSDCVRAIIHNIFALTLYSFLDLCYKSIFFSFYFLMHYILLYFLHLGGTSHGSPVRTNPFRQHYPYSFVNLFLVFFLFAVVYFVLLYICNSW